MLFKKTSPFFLLLLIGSLVGCSAADGISDLQAFVRNVHAKPRGVIEPLPVFKPYESFLYSSTSMRSPFMPPVDVESEVREIAINKNVKPDFDRVKEHLEQFPLGSMELVGSIQMEDGNLWGLVARNGAVYKVKKDYYIGQNHGKVIEITSKKIKILEIVSDGLGGWMERPRTMVLKGIEEE